MEEAAAARLFDAFAQVRDPRRANARHRLFDIFEDVKAERLDDLTSEHHTTIDTDHGRWDTHHYWITSILSVEG